MSTDYRIISGGERLGGGERLLTVLEHSSKFDIDWDDAPIAENLDVDQLAEVGLRFLQIVLYNCANPQQMKQRLAERLGESGLGS